MPGKVYRMLNVDEIRDDFPILHQEVNGEPLVYVDNAATSQKPRAVIDAISNYYETDNSNVHRGAHKLSERATNAYESARESIQHFINAESSSEIIFVKNTTEALNLVAYSWARENLSSGDEILLTAMEHHSNLIPWQMVAEKTGAELRFAELTDAGEIDRDSFSEQLNENTALVAFPHMSNVLGTVNPAHELTREAHDAGAVVVVDGAQSVPHMPVDVQEIGCDFLAFSGHKMCGPTGIGGLYGKEELLDDMPPFLGGGEMIGRVERETASWADLPHKFEAGTPNIAQAVGLEAAVDYLTELGMDNIFEYESNLVNEVIERLDQIEELEIFGRAEERGAVVSFAVEGIHPHDLSQVLDEEGVAVRAGHHCAQPLMDWLGVSATTRASFSFYNKVEEIDPIVDGIEKAREVFSGVPF